MLTENEVVQAVALHLKTEGYRIDKTCSTSERGIDIIATHPTTGKQLLVEAKGATSSRAGTARFGKEFTPGQAKSHVSVAFYYVAKLRQRHSLEGASVAMALPDDTSHRELVNDIRTALDALRIGVFFVDTTRRVRL
jgi:Holliday junction resolvase-like predicted endonuclease